MLPKFTNYTWQEKVVKCKDNQIKTKEKTGITGISEQQIKARIKAQNPLFRSIYLFRFKNSKFLKQKM